DKKKVRDAIANTNLKTFFGPVKFDKLNMNAASAIVLFQVQDGKRKTVGPKSVANAKFRYPR
ncbi:MAG: amino acid ABC transporter substrate-binding protein, partial [Chloroflexi bacterium]|nr:amino acid ABC transporter substrate-binding protein [Chloroflexota bacterium]